MRTIVLQVSHGPFRFKIVTMLNEEDMLLCGSGTTKAGLTMSQLNRYILYSSNGCSLNNLIRHFYFLVRLMND